MYNIARAKEAIKNGIRGYLLKDENGNYVMEEVNRLPFYMEGSPGIGKTEIVRQIAEELKIGYVSFSLVHHTRNSLLGLPVIQELGSGDKYTRYTMSEIIAKVLESVEEGNQEGILLLDEFPCMSETILPAMLAFLQTKNIGTHRLPEGWVIVLCGNPPEFNKSARTFDTAILDRIRKLEIQFEPQVFLDYGKNIGIHGAVLDYLNIHKDHICRYKNEKTKQELVTCRGWENISHMLKTYETLEQNVDRECILQYIKSEEISAEFFTFYGQYCIGLDNKTMSDILNGIRIKQHVKTYEALPYQKKWKLMEHMADYLETNHQQLDWELEIQNETEKMLMELKELADRDEFGYIELMTPYEICTRLDRDRMINTSTDIRKEIMQRWLNYEQTSLEHKCKTTYDDNRYKIAEEWLRQWHTWNCAAFSKEGEDLSMQLMRLFCFAAQIDQEGSLMEMLFGRINSSDLFLSVLSRYPNETYLNLCARRFQME